MARIVKHEDMRPAKIMIGNETKSICMCGLSGNKPLCDGSHHQCAGEEAGKIYKYADGKRTEVKA